MLLPIVLWGPRPPSHSITQLFISRDDKVIISGSSEGQLMVCDVFPNAIVPRSLLVGHSTSITGIDQLALGLTDLHVVSASYNGEVYKWNITDGSFILATTLQGPLNSIKVLPSSQSVLVSGQYGALHILDPVTLDVKHLLVPSDPTHWILCYTIFQPPKTKDEEIVCITINSQVKTWHLQQDTREKIIMESETKMLACPQPVCIAYNPRSLYNCLIVCQQIWRIYRGGDFVLLCSDSSNQDVPWSGGRFYSLEKVMLWKDNGMVYVYKLPSRAIRPVDYTDTTWTAEPATCIFSVSTGSLTKCIVLCRPSQRSLHNYIIRGAEGGSIAMWSFGKEVVTEGIGSSIGTCLTEAWESTPLGIINNKCDDCNQTLDITASVSLEPFSYVACGLCSGDILVGSISQLTVHSLSQSTVKPDYKSLIGHRSTVCVLCYPHTIQPTVYSSSILYSGGADFSVKIWDWEKEQLLQSFTVHSGAVSRLVLPPVDATGRLRGSVISMCADNTVAITKGTDVAPLFVGACHHTSIVNIHWRVSEDILLVHCMDDTVYVWGLSTGHLDRIESGAVSLNIIAGSTTRSCVDTPHITPPGSIFPKQTTGLSLVPFRCRATDNYSHIIIFDTELLLQLLSQGQSCQDDDDAPQLQKNPTLNFEMLRKRVTARAESRLSERRSSILKQTETAKLLDQRSVSIPSETINGNDGVVAQDTSVAPDRAIRESCSLLLSCLHAWGVDLNIDSTCLKYLGLFAPLQEVSYGTISSSSTFMLLIPGWERRVEQQGEGAVCAPFGRWCVSSTMTTQHLLSVSALANKQMSSDLSLSYNTLLRDNDKREELLRASIHESEKKAGWSHVTALHCIVLPEHVPSGYCSPLLPQLAIKWQDRCMDVREAAQALFLRELRRIGFAGRQQLVNQWYPYIVRRREYSAPEPLEKIVSTELPGIPGYFRDFINLPEKSVSSAALQDEDVSTDSYSVAVIIMGVIVAEFCDEMELKRSVVMSPEKRDAIKSSFLLTHDMLKMVSFALFAQLTQPPSLLPLRSPLRRAAVDLIGRGFNVWCEFMNLTAVIMTLLELQTDPMVSLEIKKAIAQSGSLPGTGNKERLAAAATVRAAYQASILIANNKPQHTINALSKEILTFKCDVEAGLTVQSLTPFPSSFHSILDKGRYPIYLLVQNVIEKTKSKELCPILVKVVEIMLFCIDTEQFKTRTLAELVPSLTRNPLIDYCSSTQQVAVGSAEGLIHMFDIRSSKCTPLHAHGAAISAITLSSNGRTLVTYSESERKVTIWQSSSGLLSLVSNGPLKLLRTIDNLPALHPSHKLPSFKWDGTRLVSLYLADGTKKSFAV